MYITLYISFVILGFLFTYLATIPYLKGLRGEGNKHSMWEPIATGVLLGSPALLLSYLMFREIREEDARQKYVWLISTIVLLAVHIVLTILLFYFKVLTPAPKNPNDGNSAQIVTLLIKALF